MKHQKVCINHTHKRKKKTMKELFEDSNTKSCPKKVSKTRCLSSPPKQKATKRTCHNTKGNVYTSQPMLLQQQFSHILYNAIYQHTFSLGIPAIVMQTELTLCKTELLKDDWCYYENNVSCSAQTCYTMKILLNFAHTSELLRLISMKTKYFVWLPLRKRSITWYFQLITSVRPIGPWI